MSIIQSITNREKGSQYVQDYDIALLRLKCHRDNVFKGITPNTNAPDFSPEPPVFACRFSNAAGYEHVIALANEDGKIATQDISVRHEPMSQLQGIQAHSDAIFDIAWMPKDLKFVTASGDHSARLWDVSTSAIRQVQVFCAHTRSIKCAVFRHHDKAVFATGARDGAIMIWDIRATYNDRPKPDNTIFNAHCINNSSRFRRKTLKQSQSQSITSLAFQDDYTLLSSSTKDGLIKVWDLRKNYTSHKKDPIAKNVLVHGGKSNINGFASLLVCPAGNTLYAGCMDHTIYAYNIASYYPKPVAEYFGHSNSTFYIKTCLSPDGQYLASGSSDQFAYIWHTKRPGIPFLKLNGHRDEVTCVTWCSIGEPKIVTCSDDSCHKIWTVEQEQFSEEEMTCISGFAERVLEISSLDLRSISLEKTPTTRAQKLIKYQSSSESDITPVNTPNPNLFEESHNNSGSTKRTHTQMTSDHLSQGYKSILSPIQENFEAPTKRLNIDNRGARRLFSPASKLEAPSCSWHTPQNSGYEFDEPVPSTSRTLDLTTPFSPTSNLPNFVVDGTAPHLLQMSPQKSKENVDWLTKIRKERYIQGNSKSAEKLSSPKTLTTPVRRTNRSRSTEPKKTPKSPATPLLQFFRPATKDCDNDVHLHSTNAAPTDSSPETN